MTPRPQASARLRDDRGSVAVLFCFIVLIVGVLSNGLIQLNVPSFWIEVANGLLLLGAVTVDRIRVRLTRADV